MTLNISQTEVMYISSRHKQHIINTSDTDLCYKGSTVSASPNQNLLCVTLTNTLCWDTHIEKGSQNQQLIPIMLLKCF